MPWEHFFDKERGILVVRVSGLVDRPAWESQVRDSLEHAARHRCYHFLVDYRNAHMRLGLVDLYDRPAFYERAGMPRSARIAIMFPTEERDGQFVETVTTNRGFDVRVFADEQDAREWLSRA